MGTSGAELEVEDSVYSGGASFEGSEMWMRSPLLRGSAEGLDCGTFELLYARDTGGVRVGCNGVLVWGASGLEKNQRIVIESRAMFICQLT